jgi:hypothetical protein
MTKDELVQEIIGNKANSFGEDDKPTLLSMPDEVLAKIMPVANEEDEDDVADNAAAVVDEEDMDEEETPDEKKKRLAKEKLAKEKEAVKNQETPKTAADYIANAPSGIKEMLQNGLNSYEAKKAKLIKQITANERCTFKKEQLAAKDVTELEAIANLAVVANYDGQGGPEEDISANSETALPAPTMNFESRKK